MNVVLIVQAFVFQDGGITALGANILNMAVVPCYLVWPIAVALMRIRTRPRWRVFCIGLAAWAAVVIGAAACAVELGLSGTVPLSLALPAMVSIHVLVGLAEAALTMAAVGLIWRWRKDLVLSLSEEEWQREAA